MDVWGNQNLSYVFIVVCNTSFQQFVIPRINIIVPLSLLKDALEQFLFNYWKEDSQTLRELLKRIFPGDQGKTFSSLLRLTEEWGGMYCDDQPDISTRMRCMETVMEKGHKGLFFVYILSFYAFCVWLVRLGAFVHFDTDIPLLEYINFPLKTNWNNKF